MGMFPLLLTIISLLTLTQVVVDPTINPDQMEMYADEDARGGVLEPEGIIGIKLRRDKQLAIMARLDAPYAELKRALADPSLTASQTADLKTKLTAREERLLPVYGQIALQFADLHDRAGRMQAKDTIRQPLQWKNARRFFYWRLRRRLNEESVLKKMAAAGAKTPGASRERSLETLRAWTGIADYERDDRAVATWLEEKRKEVGAKLEGLKSQGVAAEVAALLRGNKEGGLAGIRTVLQMLPGEERVNVLKYLGT